MTFVLRSRESGRLTSGPFVSFFCAHINMTDDDIQHCNSCGKAETAEQSLLQCQGCRIVRYCSKACQKDAWKTHKKFCKLVGLYPKVSTSIRLDPDKVADFDSVLNYAAVHMTNSTLR